MNKLDTKSFWGKIIPSVGEVVVKSSHAHNTAAYDLNGLYTFEKQSGTMHEMKKYNF